MLIFVKTYRHIRKFLIFATVKTKESARDNWGTVKRQPDYWHVRTAKSTLIMALKLRIKKTKMVRKVDGTKVEGYYGRVITSGTKTFEEILKSSCKGNTLDYREAKLACEMMIDGISEAIKEGYIIDLGVLGKLYPAVNGAWKEQPDDLQLADMKPKVNYKAGDDIAAAVRGAVLSWTTEKETEENTVNDDDQQPTNTGDTTGGTTGGGTGEEDDH